MNCGHNTLIRCLVDSPGGSFEDVGFQFYIINSKAQNLILYYGGGVARPLVGSPGIIYYDTDTGATYIWNPITEEYDAHGAVIEGELVDSETFHDLSDDPVTPSGDNLYLDVVTDPDLPVIYKWNGSFYVPLSSYENGSVDSIVWVENDLGSGQTKKLYIDPLTGEARIWNAVTSAFMKACNWIKKLTDTATGVKVDGTIELTDFVATPANNTLSRKVNNLHYKDNSGTIYNLTSNIFVKAQTSNISLSDLKTAAETALYAWSHLDIVLDIGSNNITIDIDFLTPPVVIRRLGTGQITFTGSDVVFANDNYKIDSNEGQVALIRAGSTENFVNIG